ncbi:hypothetical protein FTN15_03770 [Chlamydia trachomatis]|uniref:Uncharacterized protein n=1 Tax=Chlamydia muridarum (strain MoPn / Nigg) TaxID=243161 RepID=Q9PJX3_CHLMU|nr:hypothetical protein [Chlamydia muridarum]UFT35855.1 hypothetical protein FTN57_03770 [Chlamydia trachomatis]AAF39517.1 conserved hypothetical protein [Chlamydia muridarum str. Nigg]AHH23088.1 hypothetical protein TAC_03700 [Chlamydia muridarum str. Nigg3 CMUT3-5]AHH24013.1 hypothetical protein Y015_03700 [Chlamydia muridarum str. Nigg CM972]AVM88435.1 hypothetical protein C6H96_03625 [Chlamydia muridarum str. Nigg]
MTRMSKQARRRAQSPKKRKPIYAIQHPKDAPRIAFKAHTNTVKSVSVFVPQIG